MYIERVRKIQIALSIFLKRNEDKTELTTKQETLEGEKKEKTETKKLTQHIQAQSLSLAQKKTQRLCM